MNQEKIDLIKEKFPEIRENEPMKKHCSMKVGGPAKIFYEARNNENLKKIIRFALKNSIPYLVIGNGTNMIFADAGVDVLVVKNLSAKLIFESSEAIVDGGMPIARLLRKLAESNMGGIEFLAGIPGSIGGAVYGNAGAYGNNMADVVKGVLILDVDGRVIQIDNQNFKFKYRSSYLKELSNIHDRFKSPVILSVRLKVSPRPKEGTLRVINNYIKMRAGKHPPKFSCGSFFKNVSADKYPDLAKKFKTRIVNNKIPAGFIIEMAGGKKLAVGDAKVSSEHANFIVNDGRAKAVDIKKLSKLVKEKVKDEFGVELESEVEFIGDFSVKPQGLLSKIFN